MPRTNKNRDIKDEALKVALALFSKDHALERFDWGAAPLRGQDIQELNELPGILKAAIAAPDTAAERDRLKLVNTELLEALREIDGMGGVLCRAGDVARAAIAHATEGN